ncbi:MAG: hypothetical protein JSR33_13300 [Proteobacteria bacterium]|nr:hypothetical protein [Pseudomonadota bacterium]
MSIKPKDVLPDGADSGDFNGRNIRKGTVAAFLANIEIVEDSQATQEQKNAALIAIRELAPDVITLKLHKHVVFRNAEIEKILQATASRLI